MRGLFLRFKQTLFSDSIGFRAQILNAFGLLGFFLSFSFGIFYIVNYSGPGNIIGNFAAALTALTLMVFANRTKAFKTLSLLTVIIVFVIIFPFLFFTGGGYLSGAPSFFIFAIVTTGLILERRQLVVLLTLEFSTYLGCFLVAYYYPEFVIPFPSDSYIALDIIVGCITAAIVLTIAIMRHIIVYDRKMKELERANEALHGLNRMKSEFLQDMSHEMQNPLSVISVGVDYINFSIDREGGIADAHRALKTVQDEAMRLGRMVAGMVNLAATSSDMGSRRKLDFAELLTKCADVARLSNEKKANRLLVGIAPDLPFIYAEADRLRQAIANLLDNAERHTHNGEIRLSAFLSGSYVIVSVSDTGEGIPPSLLPRVFERGVSGRGGSGFGLPICKTIVEAHGGTIDIESTPGSGTTVTFTIPVYGGQSEVRVYE